MVEHHDERLHGHGVQRGSLFLVEADVVEERRPEIGRSRDALVLEVRYQDAPQRHGGRP